MEVDVRNKKKLITIIRFADDAYLDISEIKKGSIKFINQNDEDKIFEIVTSEIDLIIMALEKCKEIKSSDVFN